MKLENTYAVIESGEDGIPFQCVLHEDQKDAIDFAIELGKEYGFEEQEMKSCFQEDGYVVKCGGGIISVVLCE